MHVVRRGETLTGIAATYGTTVAALAKTNGLVNPEWIYVGQRLTVPRYSVPTSHKRVYTVQPGDTLAAIAAMHGTTVQAIARANNLYQTHFIYVGQRLVIPDASATPTPAPAARSQPQVYTVQPGDTMSGIASRYGTTVWAVARANNLPNLSLIYVGQRLTIPVSGQVGAITAGGPRLIEIDISQQRLYAWQGDTLVYSFIASTGLPGYPTRRGRFQVQSKIPIAYSGPLNLAMPDWLGIYWAGGTENGIHGLPTFLSTGQVLWAGYLGSPISYGCIVLSLYDAQLLYNWAQMGTPVVIHD